MRQRSAIVLIALLLAPATGSAEMRAGSGVDPSGDHANPQRDVIAISARYDTSGTISVTTTLREAPTAASTSFAYVVVGTLNGASCEGPLALIGNNTDPSNTIGIAVASENPTTPLEATKSQAGATITVSATNAAFTNKGYNCATSTIESSTTNEVYDTTETIVNLAVPAPPPALPEAQRPLTRAQKLARALRACRSKRTVAARRTCEKRARTKLAPPLTQAQKLTRAVAACKKGPSSRRAACIARARARFGPPAPSPLGGRIYYYPGVDHSFFCGGVCWEGYIFIDNKWAHRGIPEKDTLFPRCTVRTTKGDGCVPYTFNPATNAGTIDGKAFTLTNNRGTMTVAGESNSYGLGPLIAPGSRLGLSLKGISVFGSPYISQTVTQRWLEMGPDGRFILSGLALGNFGGPGTGIEVNFNAAQPDVRGRYQFLPGGILRLSFDDGRVDDRLVFVLKGDGPADPAKDGIFLNGTQYFNEA